MTPREYIRQIERLVASGDDRGALAFSAQLHERMARELTATELQHVGGLLEGASMALDLADADVSQGTNGAAAPARSAEARDAAGAR
jgi:hypothetical protein